MVVVVVAARPSAAHTEEIPKVSQESPRGAGVAEGGKGAHKGTVRKGLFLISGIVEQDRPKPIGNVVAARNCR